LCRITSHYDDLSFTGTEGVILYQSTNLLEEFTAAVKLFQSGQSTEAETLCLQIHAADPAKPDPLNLLAIIKAQTGHIDQAEVYFKQAINLAPKRPDFHGNYAKFLLEQGQVQNSIERGITALNLNPDQIEVHNILGNAYLLQNLPHSAIPCFQHVIRINPNHDNAHIRLGQIFKNLGQIEIARAHFATALQINAQSQLAKHYLWEVDAVWLTPLEGKNLILRPHQVADVEFLERCFRDDAFMDHYNAFIPRHQTRSELTDQIIKNSKYHPSQTRRIDWVILKKESQKVIGLAALTDIQFEHRRAEFHVGIPDIELRVGGTALEASLLVMNFVFNKVKFNKLTSVVYGTNLQAQKNSLALGFTQESYLQNHLYLQNSGCYIDLYGNGLLRKDFQANTRLTKFSKRLLDIKTMN